MMIRRQAFTWTTRLVFGLALLSMAAMAAAQYPDRPLRLLVPFAPGGGTDTAARLLGQHLSTALGQPVVIENRPGAGGVLAAETLARSPADGYTLLLSDTSYAINAGLPTRRSFDFTGVLPVAQFASSPMVLAVRKDLRAANAAEFIALAKADPGKLNVGSAGNGSVGHLTQALFDSVAGVKTTHVAYKGSSAALADLLSGQIDAVFGTLPSLLNQGKSGRVRLLAIASPKRSALAPDIPSVAESGVQRASAVSWFGVMAPASTPKEVVTRLEAAISQATVAPAFQEALKQQGMEHAYLGSAAFAQELKSEVDKWKAVAAAANITLE